jgi:DNA-binding HxlR family transcriptional regulator
MTEGHRSGCPINLALEVFGDRWTLLIVRDLMFAGKRHFRELLRSDERIASNILADRLAMLVEQGIVTRGDDPSHKQKAVYSLTEQGIALLPVLAQIGIWSRRYLPVNEELGATAAALEAGGPALWERLMAELRATHLAAPEAVSLGSGE